MSDEKKKIKEEKARWEKTILNETLKKLPELIRRVRALERRLGAGEKGE